MDIPEQVSLRKKIPDRPLIYIDSEAIVKRPRMSTAEIIGFIIPEILQIPLRLVFFVPAIYKINDKRKRHNREKDPAFPPVKDVDQSPVYLENTEVVAQID